MIGHRRRITLFRMPMLSVLAGSLLLAGCATSGQGISDDANPDAAGHNGDPTAWATTPARGPEPPPTPTTLQALPQPRLLQAWKLL